LTGDAQPLTKGSIIVTIVCAVLGVVWPFVRTFFVPEKYHRYCPSFSAVGISMINSSPEVPLAMFIGWASGKIWKRVSPVAYENYMYSAAGGQIAGMGIAAILQAVFTIAGVKNFVYTGSCIDGLYDNCP
jgi:uncharacterized oligopeptide transporter (OPT) family protein